MNKEVNADEFNNPQDAGNVREDEWAVRVDLEPATTQLWATSCKQYEAFSPGKFEWPALKRRCDLADSSYKT